MIRRIIYALVIIFMDEIMIWGVIIVMTCCHIMLAYAFSEYQWQDTLINQQHIVDEITIYILCVLLLFFSNQVSSQMRVLLGYILIGIVFAYVIYNTIVILIYSLRIMWLYIKRIFIQCRRKRIKKEV